MRGFIFFLLFSATVALIGLSFNTGNNQAAWAWIALALAEILIYTYSRKINHLGEIADIFMNLNASLMNDNLMLMNDNVQLMEQSKKRFELVQMISKENEVLRTQNEELQHELQNWRERFD